MREMDSKGMSMTWPGIKGSYMPEPTMDYIMVFMPQTVQEYLAQVIF